VIVDVVGVQIGHWTDAGARTGCTVVLLPEATVASGEVRGGAPATRETDLLDPTRIVTGVDAVLLTGGSAFGLAAADGVAAWLEERGRGFATAAGPVPIVVALGLYDLAVGDPSVRPGPAHGRLACEAASSAEPLAVGAVGAGTGATIDKVLGVEHRRPGGLVTASVTAGEATVVAVVAVNAYGQVLAAGERPAPAVPVGADHPFSNTTIGVLLTDARLDKVGCHLLAQGAHDGLARAVDPAHTRVDGDAFVAVATGSVAADLDQLRAASARAVTDAVTTLARP
jgi:L-aminopeptidase/D-esterase-like protein